MNTYTLRLGRRRAVAALSAAVLAVTLAGCGGSGSPGAATSTGSPTPTTSTPTVPSSTSTPTPTTSSASTSTTPALAAGYLPVWPFATAAEVLAWQAASRTGGTQPWHLSDRDTALSFTRGYLGYTEVDRVTSRSGSATDALVGVGWADPNGKADTVATIHLLRFGTSTDAPWEVVGTKDTTLTLTAPRYGSSVTSPMRVGGRISGVDENLRVVVRTSSSSQLLSTPTSLPAGGVATEWGTSVAYQAPAGAVLTVAVSTGGHLKTVERFAVTAVRDTGTPAVHVTWGSGEKAGGTATSAPLVNVRVGQHTDYDRVVFDVAGETTGYRVRYVDQVTTAGAGSVVPVTGGARLQLTVLAPTHDPVRLITYYQPDDRINVVDVSGYATFRQLAWAGSFEGHTEFGLGVAARLPFRVFLMAGPNGRTMLVVDVAHTW